MTLQSLKKKVKIKVRIMSKPHAYLHTIKKPHAKFHKDRYTSVQEVFHVYLNKFEIAVSHLFLIIFSKNKFTLVNQISRIAQSPRKYLLTLLAGLKQTLKMSSQNSSV